MAKGLEILADIQKRVRGNAPGAELWIDVLEKLDLCKLTQADLEGANFGKKEAADIATALNKQNLDPLSAILGTALKVKFPVWCERVDSQCGVMTERDANARWLQAYLRDRCPDILMSEIVTTETRFRFRFDVSFNDKLSPPAL